MINLSGVFTDAGEVFIWSYLKLKQSIIVTVGDKTRSIKMSFGLLDEAARLIGDIDALPEMTTNAGLRKAVVSCMISQRDEEGTITRPYNPFVDEMSPADVVMLLKWVAEHILDFFLQALNGTKSLMTERAADLKNLMSI